MLLLNRKDPRGTYDPGSRIDERSLSNNLSSKSVHMNISTVLKVAYQTAIQAIIHILHQYKQAVRKLCKMHTFWVFTI